MTTLKVGYYYPYLTIRKLVTNHASLPGTEGVFQDTEPDMVKPGQPQTNQDELVSLGLEKLKNSPEVTQLESGWIRI